MKTFVILFAGIFFVLPLAAKEIVLTIDAPGGEVSGLAWGDNTLWCVDATADTVYSIDPATGDILFTFGVNLYSGYFPTGLAFSEAYSMVFVGAWNNGTTGYVYKYKTDGTFVGYSDMCGG